MGPGPVRICDTKSPPPVAPVGLMGGEKVRKIGTISPIRRKGPTMAVAQPAAVPLGCAGAGGGAVILASSDELLPEACPTPPPTAAPRPEWPTPIATTVCVEEVEPAA